MNHRLENEKVSSLLFSLALPSILAQLATLIYNMVDRIYIGRLPDGGLSIAGIGLCTSIITIITAFSNLFGRGGAPLASIKLGEKNPKEAERILGNAFSSLILTSLIIMFCLLVWGDKILILFGASQKTLPYALSYLRIYAVGTVFIQLTVGLNYFINTQGYAKFGMMTLLIGGILNIILDPIFIFVLGMGVKGAALATVISQALSAIWVVYFLLSKKSVIKIKIENLNLEKEILKKTGALGISPFIMQSTESLVLLTLNSGLQKYGGDIYVGSMSILTSVLQLITVPVSGITQGIQPVISYNFGAGNRKRVLQTFKGMLGVCLTVTIMMGGIGVIFPEIYVGIFTDSKELFDLTSKFMPIFVLGMVIFGIQQAIQGTFLALGQAKYSIFIALLRKVILLVPLAVVLPIFMGVKGIYYAEPIADITSVSIASITFLLTYKKILKSRGMKK